MNLSIDLTLRDGSTVAWTDSAAQYEPKPAEWIFSHDDRWLRCTDIHGNSCKVASSEVMSVFVKKARTVISPEATQEDRNGHA